MNIKLFSLITLFFVFTTLSIFAQAPKMQWSKCYGGTGVDRGHSIKQTTDGGYIMAGSSGSTDGDNPRFNMYSGNDIWIIKTNDTGKLNWVYYLTGTDDDEINSVAQTKDGGYIAAGYTASMDGDYTGMVHHYFASGGAPDALIIKLDSAGKLKWKKCFGGGGGEEAEKIIQTKDGGYMFCGYTTSIVDGDVTHRTHIYRGSATPDIWVVKLDDTGRIMWQQTIGGSGSDNGLSVIQTMDGNYIVAGYTGSSDSDITKNRGGWDALTIKLNDTGGIVWKKTYGGTGSEAFVAIEQTADGGYFCTGNSTSNDMDVTGNHLDTASVNTYDIWVAKLNDTGALSWEQSYGGTGFDNGTDGHQTFDGGYFISATTQSADGDVSGVHSSSTPINSDGWVLKLNSSGVIEWQKCLGGSGIDGTFSITQTTDSDYIALSYAESIDGDRKENDHGADFWVVKFSNKPMPTSFVEELTENFSFNISPNPSHSSFTLQYHLSTEATVTVTDVAGKIISTIPLPKNTTQTIINAAAWQPGVYFYSVMQNGSVLESGKLVKE